MRPNIIKVLEENIGRTLFDINHRNIFFDPSRRVMEIKTKNKKWDLIKLKSLCTAKETINKMKRQPTDWEEKTSASDMTNKLLVSKIYEQFMMLNSINTNNPVNKWADDLNGYFSKDVQMTNRHMKTGTTSLIIRERNANKNYNEISPHISQNGYHPLKKKSTKNKCWRRCGEKGTLLHCWWE